MEELRQVVGKKKSKSWLPKSDYDRLTFEWRGVGVDDQGKLETWKYVNAGHWRLIRAAA
jgi:hypothetical protein